MSYQVGIVGATGAVGQELIELLHEREFPCEIHLLASARSAGKVISYKDKSWTVKETTPDAFEGLDLAIFSAGGSTSVALAKEAVKRNCIVVDNSSAFRMDDEVPLVIPEINPDAVDNHKGIIANPNCTTAISLMGLYPLHQKFGLKRFIATTYQAVSGSGAMGIVELENQVKALTEGQEVEKSVYPHQIAFNAIPHVDSFLENGYTKEELKMLNESKKIVGLETLQVSTTCVRIPVKRAHSVSIEAEFNNPIDLKAAREAISAFEGAELVDEPEENRYPMPLDYTRKVPCGVGRIRKSMAYDNGIAFWVCGDQLWKGAALNAVQIVELLHQKQLIQTS